MCDVGSGGGGIDWSWQGGGRGNKKYRTWVGLGYSWMSYHVLPQKEGWGRRLSWSCCRAQWAATLDKQCVGTQRPQVYELPEKFLSWWVWAFVNALKFQLLKIYLIQLFITPVPMEPRHLIYHPVLSILNMKPEFKKMQNLQCFIAQSSCLSCYKNEIPVVFLHEECSSCEKSWVKPLMHLILETINFYYLLCSLT